jgi:starvation-inducible DNA-binding protein
MKANIGLNDETRKSVSDILNAELADAHVLYQKTRNYHWNVVGPQFESLHILFEKQYTLMFESIDEMAERVRALNNRALGSMEEMLANARLKEDPPGAHPNATHMVQNLLTDHEAVIRQMREDIDTVDEDCNDPATADFITGLVEAHEKMAWMLRSFLEGEPVQSRK